MSYRDKAHFDQPTAREAERSRRMMLWLAPVLMFQQASRLFEADESVAKQALHIGAWCLLTIAILWVLAGWPVRWLSERDRLILNDEGQRAMRADSMQWGLVASVIGGCALMIATIWIEVDTKLAINAVVTGGVVTAAIRFAWLNREEPEEDD